jgi:hypothetical protein
VPTMLPSKPKVRPAKGRELVSYVFNGFLVASATALAAIVLLEEQRYVAQQPDQFAGSIVQVLQGSPDAVGEMPTPTPPLPTD